MSRSRAARLAWMKIHHPLWRITRDDDDGTYAAEKNGVTVVAADLDQLGLMLDRRDDPAPGEDTT